MSEDRAVTLSISLKCDIGADLYCKVSLTPAELRKLSTSEFADRYLEPTLARFKQHILGAVSE